MPFMRLLAALQFVGKAAAFSSFVQSFGTVPTSSKTTLAMGLTLYGSQGSRSPLINWAAHELDLDFTIGDLSENPHPFGQIPCLTDDNGVMLFESAAILIYLSSIASRNVTPQQEAAILSWITWANASLDPICFIETPNGKVYDTGLRQSNSKIDALDVMLEEQQFLVEGDFSVADVAVAGYLLFVVQFFPDINLSRWSHVVRFMKDCASRPAYATAFGRNIQTYLLQALSDMDKPRKVFGMF